MLESIKYKTEFVFKDIPKQWVSRFELYYPDLPQFPIIYVHIIENGVRIYGFPVFVSFELKEDNCCNAKVLFLSNIDLNINIDLKNKIEAELKERFGIANKIGVADLSVICRGQEEYKIFFTDLWQYVSKLYGEFIPFGRYYEEIFSIIRFVSAWQPKTGRQSEMRMLYNFLSAFGESIPVENEWNFLGFYLIPNYSDIKNNNYSDFPKFKILFEAIQKIWVTYFVCETDIEGTKIKSMKGAWPQAKDDFINKVTRPLFQKGKITIDEREAVEKLVDAFNRHSWRAAFFIWSIMSIFQKDYYQWDKNFFIKFYLSKNTGVGISEKVIACFLQQGFKNDEVIPIDIWVQSFYEAVLGIDSKEEFFNKFDKLGKLERIIWLSSQANKTNIKTFFDLLWCTRYGDTGNNELRGANPISCYECKLRKSCPGYQKISDYKVLVIDKEKLKIEGSSGGKIVKTKPIIKLAEKKGCIFICVTEESVPKKIFKKDGKKWKLVDEFSGFILKNQKLNSRKNVLIVSELISDLPSFF